MIPITGANTDQFNSSKLTKVESDKAPGQQRVGLPRKCKRVREPGTPSYLSGQPLTGHSGEKEKRRKVSQASSKSEALLPESTSFQNNQSIINDLDKAVQQGDYVSVIHLIEKYSWLIEKNPDCLLVCDEKNRTVVFILCALNKPELFKLAIATEQGKKALVQKSDLFFNLTTLHYAATMDGFVEIIHAENVDKEAWLIRDDSGRVPLHYAVVDQSLNICLSMVKMQPESLIVKNINNNTPIDLMMQHKESSREVKVKFLSKVLDYPCVQEKLCHVDYFANLSTGDQKGDEKIHRLRKKVFHEFQAVPFNKAAAQAENNIPLKRALDAVDTISEIPGPNVLKGQSIEKWLDSEAAEGDHNLHLKRARARMPKLNLSGNLPLQSKARESKERESTTLQGLHLKSSVEVSNHEKEKQARAVLKGLGQVGVYSSFTCYTGETTKKFWSLGDENAAVDTIRSLAYLGVPHIQMRLSPPNDINPGKTIQVTPAERKQFSQAEKERYERNRQVAWHKLAALLPEFNPALGLPQDIHILDTKVTILDCDDVAKEPPLTISMVDPITKYGHCGTLGKNYMVLKPYRYGSYLQTLCTDIKGSCHRAVPLHLPPNSIIPEPGHQALDFKNNDDEKRWIDDRLKQSSMGNSSLAENVAKICSLSRQGNVHSGVVYGLHHHDLTSKQKERVVGRWFDIVKESAEKTEPNKASLICMGKSQLMDELLQSICREKNIPVIDMEQADAKQPLDQLIQQGKVGLCLLPDLPKPVFQHLITSSNLPMLTEGANSTSFLLQTGHAYLSALPEGNTQVPVDMGYPLEALKAKVFSYKLKLNEESQDELKTLHDLIKSRYYYGIEHHLENESSLENLKFLLNQKGREQQTQLMGLTIWDLVRKEQNGTLGDIERQALLSALDPSNEAIVEYIAHTQDSNTPTAHHIAMQQMHVGQAFNNALISALVEFAKIKKLDV
ncbi:hypothetical protein [Endozoicomonas sp.]|uniref:hypothetical protein n=1 Tax=Endozoicomonas sp. TaxID=1892382 RepID=UPI00383A3E37